MKDKDQGRKEVAKVVLSSFSPPLSSPISTPLATPFTSFLKATLDRTLLSLVVVVV